jgi:ribosomal subunit interface protein
MIQLDITTRNFKADAKLVDYIHNKLGGVERYVPRAARRAAHLQVILEDDPSGREHNRFVCETLLTLPNAKLVSREGTINMYAAVDIVEAQLKQQIATYKGKTGLRSRRARLMSRLLRRPQPESVTTESSL